MADLGSRPGDITPDIRTQMARWETKEIDPHLFEQVRFPSI